MSHSALAKLTLVLFWTNAMILILTVLLWMFEAACRSISDRVSAVEGYLEHIQRDHFKRLKEKLNDGIIQAARWNSPDLMGCVCELADDLKAVEDAWITFRYSCA